MKAWSWGNFELDWSVAGPLTADYTQLQPDDRTGYPATWSGDAPVGWSAAHRKRASRRGIRAPAIRALATRLLGI